MQIQRVIDFIEEHAISAVFTVTLIVYDQEGVMISRRLRHITGTVFLKNIQSNLPTEFPLPATFPEIGLFTITASLDQTQPETVLCKVPFHPDSFVVDAPTGDRKRRMETQRQDWIEFDQSGCNYRYEIHSNVRMIIQDYEMFLSQIPTST